MGLIVFDDIREYISPDHVTWLQETVLPLPLEGCVLSNNPPTKVITDTVSFSKSHTYTQHTYNALCEEIVDTKWDFDNHEETLPIKIVLPDEHVAFTSITYITNLSTNMRMTAIIADRQIASVIALKGLRNSILLNFDNCATLVQPLVLTIDSIFDLLEDDCLTIDMLENIFGGLWTIIDKNDLQSKSSPIPAEQTSTMQEDWFDDTTPGLFLPNKGLMLEIKDSAFINSLFKKVSHTKAEDNDKDA